MPVTVGTAEGLATVVEDKPMPLQVYMIVPVPPLADDVRFTVPPRHIGPSLLTVVVGIAFTVTEVVYCVPELQPEPVLLTVSEYTSVPVTVGTAVGLATVVEVRLAPLHEYIIVPVPPLADEVRFTVPPRHIGVLLVGDAVGTSSTVTEVV